MICLRTLVFAFLAVPLAAAAQTPPSPNPNPNPAPTPTPAPAPAPKFNSGSPLDGIRNDAWSKLQEMTDAYEKCDPARYERALNELEQLRRNARAAAAAARGSAEFSQVKPEEANGLAEAIGSMIEPRRYLLADLKRECARAHRPGGIGRILGPRPDAPQQPTTPAPQPATGTTVTPPPCPPPQPQPQTQPSPPVESILDDIEEMERWEKEQRKAARERAQNPPAQGLTQTDAQAIARQQATIESFEADLAELKKLLKEGRIDEAHELVDDLDEWLDRLGGRPAILGAGLTRPELPPGLIDEWDRRIDEVIDEFEKLPKPRFQLDPTSSRILDLHNQTRLGLGLAPMHWDYGLACQAISYGPTLARYDVPIHSPRTGRETSRENLLQALPGTPVDRMVGVWIAEQKNFVPGIFPNVSRTGNWSDVGHFTQIAWPTTTSVGCGVQRGIGRFDWLICRYAPPGNRDGTPLFTDNGTGTVIADNSGIAPPNSSTPAFNPGDLPRLKDGGGMEQIDPPAPPPPPPPTAADAAPGGNEDNHPLVSYGAEAFIRHSAAVDCGDTAKAEAELAKLSYALDELRKRLRAARKAGPFSAVKPDDVQRQINMLESFLRAAEQRKPRNACPTPPATPASEPRSLGSRTGHRLQFGDSSECTVELAHQKGRKVTLDDNGIEVADSKTAASYPPPPCPPPPPPP